MTSLAPVLPPPQRDEYVGLAVAAGLHVALLAWLVWQPVSVTPPLPPERMTVTLSEPVLPVSTSPDPAAEAAADVAPQSGEAVAPKSVPDPAQTSAVDPAPARPPPVAKSAPVPKPQPTAVPIASPVAKPSPLPRATPQPRPRPTPAPAPRPAPAASARPVPPPPTRPVSAPATRPAPAAASGRIGDDFLKGVPAPRTGRPGGTRIGDDFLKGIPGAQTSGTSRSPAAASIGPAVQSALAGSISRQLKPHWAVPQGVDAEKLVTILSWSLNRDGSLAGVPQVVRQEGITDANRAQAARHAEQAIRAVQLAAPFNLPAEYYDAWKRVVSFRFDRKLSQ